MLPGTVGAAEGSRGVPLVKCPGAILDQAKINRFVAENQDTCILLSSGYWVHVNFEIKQNEVALMLITLLRSAKIKLP